LIAKPPLVRLRLAGGAVADQPLGDGGYATMWTPHYSNPLQVVEF
jgi:hypothetical protein